MLLCKSGLIKRNALGKHDLLKCPCLSVLTYVLMHEEFDKTHHIAFLHLSSVHLLAATSDLYRTEVKIRLVKFWPPASKKQKKNVHVVKYSSEVWNSGLKSWLSYRIPMDGWANQLSSGSWSWTAFPVLYKPCQVSHLMCVDLPNKQ